MPLASRRLFQAPRVPRATRRFIGGWGKTQKRLFFPTREQLNQMEQERRDTADWDRQRRLADIEKQRTPRTESSEYQRQRIARLNQQLAQKTAQSPRYTLNNVRRYKEARLVNPHVYFLNRLSERRERAWRTSGLQTYDIKTVSSDGRHIQPVAWAVSDSNQYDRLEALRSFVEQKASNPAWLPMDTVYVVIAATGPSGLEAQLYFYIWQHRHLTFLTHADSRHFKRDKRIIRTTLGFPRHVKHSRQKSKPVKPVTRSTPVTLVTPALPKRTGGNTKCPPFVPPSVWQNDAQQPISRTQLHASFQEYIDANKTHNTCRKVVDVGDPRTDYLRVATQNVHFWTDMTGAHENWQALWTDLQLMDADILCLQEVTLDASHFLPRASEAKLKAEFVERGYPYSFFCLAAHFHGSRFGNLVLSKVPFVSAETISLGVDTVQGESRCAIRVVVPISFDRSLVIYNVHLDVHDQTEQTRVKQVDILLGHVKQDVGAGLQVIVTGDFNSVHSKDYDGKTWEWIEQVDRLREKASTPQLAQAKLRQVLQSAFDVATTRPPPSTVWTARTVDYLLLSPNLLSTDIRTAQPYFTAASDHLALYVDVWKHKIMTKTAWEWDKHSVFHNGDVVLYRGTPYRLANAQSARGALPTLMDEKNPWMSDCEGGLYQSLGRKSTAKVYSEKESLGGTYDPDSDIDPVNLLIAPMNTG